MVVHQSNRAVVIENDHGVNELNPVLPPIRLGFYCIPLELQLPPLNVCTSYTLTFADPNFSFASDQSGPSKLESPERRRLHVGAEFASTFAKRGRIDARPCDGAASCLLCC